MTDSPTHRPTGADLIAEFLVGSRMPPKGTCALHAAIQIAVESKQPNDVVDALLAQCETAECAVCGSICCPHGEPLHFHHDGCPACDYPFSF